MINIVIEIYSTNNKFLMVMGSEFQRLILEGKREYRCWVSVGAGDQEEERPTGRISRNEVRFI